MDWAALLELLNNLEAASGVEEDEVLLYLQQFKDGFVKLLDFPVSVIRAGPALRHGVPFPARWSSAAGSTSAQDGRPLYFVGLCLYHLLQW